MQKDVQKQIKTKGKIPSISTTLSGVISQARSFLLAGCGTLGKCSRFAKPRLKITVLDKRSFIYYLV